MIKKIINNIITKEYKFKYLILSAMSGILLALSFQKFNFYLLAWVSFIPLIYCVYKNKFKYSIFYGFITGIICSMISINWMFLFLLNNTKSLKAAIIVSVIVWIYLAIYFVLWVVMLRVVKNNKKILVAVFLASFWVILEYIKNYFLMGFPINLLGYSQSSFIAIIQISDIFGVYGVSFVVILINFLLFYWLYNKDKKYLIFSVIIFIALLFYGFVRIDQVSNMDNENKIKIGVVQPNIEQYKKWRMSLKDEIINTIYDVGQYFQDKNCEIVLYPETLLPRMLEEIEEIQVLVRDISKYSNLSLIGGKSIENKNLYNTIFLISKDGNILDKYKKKHLVLFGEYIPFDNFLVEMLKRVNLTDNFTEEHELKVFKFDKYTLGINICSENYYPYLSRDLVLKGATLLTNHSNVSWCDGLFYPYQHFTMNIFRAIENRKYLIVSANTGVSGIISPTGKLIRQTKNQERICFTGDVYTNNYITLYNKIGDSFVFICGIYVAIFLLYLLVLLFLKYQSRYSKHGR